jgi:hypothetical protein
MEASQLGIKNQEMLLRQETSYVILRRIKPLWGSSYKMMESWQKFWLKQKVLSTTKSSFRSLPCLGQEIQIGYPIAFIVNDDQEYKAFLELSPSEYPTIGNDATTPSVPTPAPIAPSTTITTANQPVDSPTPSTTKVVTATLSPAARHLVESKSLDVSNLVGTLKGGRIITKEDVLNGIKSGKVLSAPLRATTPVAAVAPAPIVTPSPSLPAPVPSLVSNSIGGTYTDIPNSNMRKVTSSLDSVSLSHTLPSGDRQALDRIKVNCPSCLLFYRV